MEKVKKFLKNFNLKEDISSIETLDVRGVTKVEAYKILTKDKTYFLKEVVIKNTPLEEVNKSAFFVDKLVKKGFKKAPQNIKSISGEFTYIDPKGAVWQMQEYISGRHIKTEDLSDGNVKNISKTAVELHKTFLNLQDGDKILGLSKEVEYKKMFCPEETKKMEEVLPALLKKDAPDGELIKDTWEYYLKVSGEIESNLKKINEDSFQKGVIFRDINGGNLIFNEDTDEVTSLVDWDTAVWGNIIQDLAYVSSQYLFDIDNVSKTLKRLRLFFSEYNKELSLKENEKSFIPTLSDMMLARAMRWWSKRYFTIFSNLENKFNKEDFEEVRLGFKKTVTMWFNNRDIIKSTIKDALV